MDRSRYNELIAEFSAASNHARDVSRALAGLTCVEPHRLYAELIFVKLLAHCITLRRLSPAVDGSPQTELWDLPSNSVIARAAIEAFDALAYVALQPVKPVQREFRILLWELHDDNRRAKMLEHIGSQHPRCAEILASAQGLEQRVIEHPCFNTLSPSLQKKIRSHDPPAFINSQRDRCLANGINHDYYNFVTMELSQYAHTLPYAVNNLSKFRAGDAEALQMMSLPIRYVLPFLLRATEGLRLLFPGITPQPPKNVSKSMTIWNQILAKGLNTITAITGTDHDNSW